MPRLTSLLAEWADSEKTGQALADAVLRAGAPLSDEQLRALPGSP